MMTKFDEEIQEVEARLAREREALVHQAEDLGQTARDAAISPKGLMAAAAVGFMLGELTRPRRSHVHANASSSAPRKLGFGGIIGGAALALLRSRYGSPAALSRAAWEFAAAQRARRNSTRTPTAAAAGAASGGSYAASAPARASVAPPAPPVP